MAMLDYGAIAFKNRKLISTEMFTPMMDMVGWEDDESDVDFNHNPLGLKNNYFAYVGDVDCTLAFYKNIMVIAERNNTDGTYFLRKEYLMANGYTWSKWTGYADGRIKVTKRNGYLVCKWEYKGDKYKVYFGYGVDFDYYKKRRIVNYYRSPEYKILDWIYWTKRRVRRWLGK